MKQRVARSGVVAALCATVVLAGCTARSGAQSADTPPSGAPTAATTAAEPTASDPATALLAATGERLGPQVLPPEFSFVDSVDAGGPTSTVYSGLDGPDGPTLYVYTDIPADYTSERETGLAWERQPGFGDPYVVSIARGPDGWTFVDIDAPHDVSVQLIGHRMTEGDVVATAHRLLDGIGALAR